MCLCICCNTTHTNVTVITKNNDVFLRINFQYNMIQLLVFTRLQPQVLEPYKISPYMEKGHVPQPLNVAPWVD